MLAPPRPHGKAPELTTPISRGPAGVPATSGPPLSPSHEVAWKGACTKNDNVFDGCLKVDGDADPTAAPHTPLLATNMLFGDCAAMDYRLRLCPPGPSGCGACNPQPGSTRQRRAIH